jgi:hypothetical protein
MKRLMLNWLVEAACLILCVGCSSLKSSQEQQATAVTPPVQKQAPSYHNSPMARVVKNWWETPPPDFPQGSADSGWGWYWLGLILQGSGQYLAK